MGRSLVCPVCGNENLEPISRAVFVKVPHSDPEVLGFRCGNDHVFTTAPLVTDKAAGSDGS